MSLSLYLSLSVFVKCNAISLLVYIYLLLCIRTKFIYTGRLSSWKLCLCPCICLCVCLCLCLCHLQMKPGAVLFPTMYDMLNPTLESWKYWCFIDDRLSDWRRRRRRRRRRRKAIVRSAPDGSDNNEELKESTKERNICQYQLKLIWDPVSPVSVVHKFYNSNESVLYQSYTSIVLVLYYSNISISSTRPMNLSDDTTFISTRQNLW